MPTTARARASITSESWRAKQTKRRNSHSKKNLFHISTRLEIETSDSGSRTVRNPQIKSTPYCIKSHAWSAERLADSQCPAIVNWYLSSTKYEETAPLRVDVGRQARLSTPSDTNVRARNACAGGRGSSLNPHVPSLQRANGEKVCAGTCSITFGAAIIGLRMRAMHKTIFGDDRLVVATRAADRCRHRFRR